MDDRNINKHGCGLGLSISKTLSSALGGDIVVESEKGKGTTFILKIRNMENFILVSSSSFNNNSNVNRNAQR